MMSNAISKRIDSIEFLRVVSMFAVIIIHITASVATISRAGFFLNQITRFAVPMFVILSGCALSLSRKDNAAGQIAKLVPLYLLWCLVYRSILTPHLYFVVVIVQLYALFPYMKKLRETHPKLLFSSAFVIGFLATLAIHLRSFGISLTAGNLHTDLWFLFPTWIAYFAAGLLVTPENIGRIRAFCKKYAAWLVIAALSGAYLYVLEAKYTNTFDGSIKPSLWIYCALIFAAAIGAGEHLCTNQTIRSMVLFAGKHSLTVYFCHLRVLEEIRKYIVIEPIPARILIEFLLCLIFSLLFALVFDGILARMRKLLL